MFAQKSRHGETGAIPYRTGRFYSVGTEWWFAIRKGPDMGPYENKVQARQALIEFLNDQFTFEKHLQRDRLLLNL